MTVLELGHGLLDLGQRPVDGAAHAQGQQRRAAQAGGNHHQAGEQAAVTAQQHAVVRQFQLDPAQQAIGLFGNHIAGQVAMLAEHRQQITRRIAATASQHLRAIAHRRLVKHGRTGVGQ
ncbi:hypothetical protein D3C87_1287520 [compost metagenome]